jgi:chromosome segregation ATPase
MPEPEREIQAFLMGLQEELATRARTIDFLMLQNRNLDATIVETKSQLSAAVKTINRHKKRAEALSHQLDRANQRYKALENRSRAFIENASLDLISADQSIDSLATDLDSKVSEVRELRQKVMLAEQKAEGLHQTIHDLEEASRLETTNGVRTAALKRNIDTLREDMEEVRRIYSAKKTKYDWTESPLSPSSPPPPPVSPLSITMEQTKGGES